MVHPELILHMLLMLVVANGTPVLARWVLGSRWAIPLDGGRRLRDGQALFGKSKTIRGIVLSVPATALASLLLGHGPEIGAVFGILSLAGDLSTSFLKRRLGLPPSSRSFPLDYLAESLLPLLFLKHPLGLTALDVLAVVLAFVLTDLITSRILFRLGIRNHPY